MTSASNTPTGSTTHRSLIMLDIGDVFRHDDTDDEWVEAIDIRQFDEYGRRIVAYAEPETGEYNGMIAAPPISSPYSKIVEVSTNG